MPTSERQLIRRLRRRRKEIDRDFRPDLDRLQLQGPEDDFQALLCEYRANIEPVNYQLQAVESNRLRRSALKWGVPVLPKDDWEHASDYEGRYWRFLSDEEAAKVRKGIRDARTGFLQVWFGLLWKPVGALTAVLLALISGWCSQNSPSTESSGVSLEQACSSTSAERQDHRPQSRRKSGVSATRWPHEASAKLFLEHTSSLLSASNAPRSASAFPYEDDDDCFEQQARANAAIDMHYNELTNDARGCKPDYVGECLSPEEIVELDGAAGGLVPLFIGANLFGPYGPPAARSSRSRPRVVAVGDVAARPAHRRSFASH